MGDLLVGRRIDQWRLTRYLGRGYFGRVFEAMNEDGLVQRPIALKLVNLNGERASDERSLLREIAHLYAMTHEHLVAVRADPRRAALDGDSYIAIGLELCGQTLTDRLRSSADRSRMIRTAVPDVLRGLDYMHRQGAIHRDLHGGNVLELNGVWKVSDFGQARLLDANGLVRGGPAGATELVAPEVAAGGPATTAVDVWALGVLVHHALTGRYLFEPAKDLRRIAEGRPHLADTLPDEWRPFVSAATQEVRSRPDAAELLAMLLARSDAARTRARALEPDRTGNRSVRPSPATSVACASLVAGHFEVFALDARGKPWHRWWWQEAGWSEWKRMTCATRLKAIAAGSHDERHQEVFGITRGGRVLNSWNWLDPAAPFGPSTPSHWHGEFQGFAGTLPDGRRPVDLACSSLVDGHFEVFVLDDRGVVWHSWWWASAGWSAWDRVDGGERFVAIAAGSHDERHQELFAVERDGRVLHRWNWLDAAGHPGPTTPSEWKDHWGEFAGRLPDGRTPADIACSSFTEGRLEVFVLDERGGLWHAWWSDADGWSAWYGIPAAPRLATVAAGTHDPGHEEVMGVTPDGVIESRWNVLDEHTASRWREPWERLS